MRRLNYQIWTVVFCLCTATFTSKTSAQTILSGTFGANGNNLTYLLQKIGNDTVLTIRGSGAMYTNNYASAAPWNSYRSQIKTVIIGDSVTTIGYAAFYQCSSLTAVNIPNSVTIINEYAFRDCNSLTSVTIGNSVTTIKAYAFQRCSTLVSVRIPPSVTEIGQSAFYQCISLTSLTLPNSLTTIGRNAFYECISLTSLTIPNSVIRIEPYAFYKCSSMVGSLIIPPSVTFIGNNAFWTCAGFNSIILNSSTITLEGNAFGYCWGVTDIYSETRIPSPNVDAGAFNMIPCTTRLHIPIGSTYDYMNTRTNDTFPKGWDYWGIWHYQSLQMYYGGQYTHFKCTTGPNTNAGRIVEENLYSVTVINGTVRKRYYDPNDTVTIIADTGRGQFMKWVISPAVTFINGTTANSDTAKFIMPANAVTATATYTFPVTVNGGTGSGNYEENDTVSITANILAGQRFKEWVISPNVTFINGTGKYSDTAKFIMPANAVTATATYEAIYTVIVNDGTGSGDYTEDAIVSITANTASAGQRFKEWIITPSVTFTDGTTAKSNTAKFRMPNQAVTATATYDALYPVTVNDGTGNGDYAENDIVSITANTAPAGQRFKEWIITPSVTFTDGTTAKSNTAKFRMPNQAVTATAIYEAITYTVTVQNDGHGTATANPETAIAGKEITLTATPKEGYEFERWVVTGNTVTIGNDNKFIMPAKNVTVKAYFKQNNVGIVGANNYSSLRVYPNPTNGILHIISAGAGAGTGAGATHALPVQVYDIYGREIVNCQLSILNSIDISHLANGLYFLKVGNKMVKIVKE